MFSKVPNYQRGVLLISAAVMEEYFEGKTSRELHQGVLVFFYENASAHSAFVIQKKIGYE
jgi:hypothetical protein